MTQTETRPRRRWVRRLLVAGGASVVLLLLVRTGVDLWASSRVNAQLERLEAQHGSLDVSTLRVARVPEEQNRARAIRAAAALVVGQDQVPTSLPGFLAQREPASVPAELQAFVEGNRAALRVADEARRRRLSNWEVDYPAVNYSPGLAEVRRLSNVLYLDARMALDAGQPEEAARALATGLALSASFRQEPSLVTQLIRCTVALQQFEGVQRLLTESDPSESALQMLSSALAENRMPAPMHIGLLGELKSFQAELDRDAGAAPWIVRPLHRMARAQYLEELGRLLDTELGPRPRPELSEKEPPTWSLIPGGVGLSIRGLERAVETGDWHHSALSMTELAVALRRFRLAQGEYPATLAAVAPRFIAMVPTDALTGKLPTYAREGSGFTLKSEHTKNLERQTSATLAWTMGR